MSVDNLDLYPCYAQEAVLVLISGFMKFTSNKLFVLTNFEDFSSTVIIIDIFVAQSQLDKSFFAGVESDLEHERFSLVDDALNPGDLSGRPKRVTLIEVTYSSLASRAIS